MNADSRFGIVICGTAVSLLILAVQCLAAPPSQATRGGRPNAPKATLEAEYDNGLLTVRLRNTSKSPLIVYSKLVFVLQVTAVDARGSRIDLIVNPVAKRPPKTAPEEPFRPLKPGEEMIAKLDLKGGFPTYLWAGHSTRVVDGVFIHTPFVREAMISLPRGASPKSIEVLYGPSFFFDAAIRPEMGSNPQPPGWYKGPLRAVAKVKDRTGPHESKVK